MSRRKKQLGDVSSRELLRRTEAAVTRAQEQVASGDCGAALDNLMDAGVLLGSAESTLTGGARAQAEIDILVDLDRELIDVREGFLAKCICTREPRSRPLTFRRGRR